MNVLFKGGIAAASLCATLVLTGAANAQGHIIGSTPSGCYLRGDVGYSWRDTPSIRNYQRPTAVGPVSGETLDDSWLGEIGIGCARSRLVQQGSIKDAPVESSYRFRGELVFGFRGKSDVFALPPAPIPPGPPPPIPPVDPLTSDLRSYNLMFNAFLDFQIGRVMPYVGVGIGGAYHDLGTVTIVNGGTLTFDGSSGWDLAWSLMAGVGIPISQDMILDIGYRYIDMGSLDVSGGGVSFTLDDLNAHELKIGLRWHFGNS